jgi:hypothetical protein
VILDNLEMDEELKKIKQLKAREEVQITNNVNKNLSFFKSAVKKIRRIKILNLYYIYIFYHFKKF